LDGDGVPDLITDAVTEAPQVHELYSPSAAVELRNFAAIGPTFLGMPTSRRFSGFYCRYEWQLNGFP
jgi:hypothetical protein